jgi:hypothetical protein
MAATVGAMASVSSKNGWTDRARSQNSRTDAHPPISVLVRGWGSGTGSGSTRYRISWGMASGSRLVTRTRSNGRLNNRSMTRWA